LGGGGACDQTQILALRAHATPEEVCARATLQPNQGSRQFCGLRRHLPEFPETGDNTFIGPFGSVLYGKYLHIEVRLDGCARQGTATATCDFSIWDRNPLEMIDMRIGAFALIDNKGQGIGLTGDGAKCCEGRNQSMIVPGVVSHAHYTYSGLDPDVTSIARVSIKVGEAGSGGNDDFEFRDVPLGQAAAQVQEFTPTPKLPQKLVADDNGWRFTVLRCSPLAR
jgi:hypothetical protein